MSTTECGRTCRQRGLKIDGTEVPATALTFPGDDDALAAVRADFERIDATQHR